MIVALATLVAGAVIGYLAQRSRLCFVGGLRDFLLIRDTELLKGAVAFFLAAWLAFPLAAMAGGAVWEAPDAVTAPVAVEAEYALAPLPTIENPNPAPFRPWLPAAIAVTAGLGLGAVSTLANGCPLRQHVLAGQGARSAWVYLAGFYAGALIYHQAIQPWLARLLP